MKNKIIIKIVSAHTSNTTKLLNKKGNPFIENSKPPCQHFRTARIAFTFLVQP